MTVPTFPFPSDPEVTAYKIFPAALENDDHVFFHGTAEQHLASILREGFKPKTPLESVSFATGSEAPLGYACNARGPESPNGCIIAVRYERLDQPGLALSGSVLHDYKQQPPPTIVGYCIIPATYVYR